MNRALLVILFFSFFITEFTVAQTKLVIRDLKGLEWEYDKRYSLLDSNDYFAYSFSVADVTDPTNKWQKLDKCRCVMRSDTVNIWIHNLLAEGGIAVSIKLTADYWESYIQNYSDTEEFETGYFKNYKPEKSTFFINKPNYRIEDVLIGSIDISSKNIESLQQDEITFIGKFQCIITEKRR